MKKSVKPFARSQAGPAPGAGPPLDAEGTGPVERVAELLPRNISVQVLNCYQVTLWQ
jgi:hypothetical protein